MNSETSNLEWENIHEAAYFNNFELLEEELNSGVDPNLIINNFKSYGPSKDFYSKKIIVYWDKLTALYIACQKGHTKCVNLLMQRGANPNIEAYNQYYKMHVSPLNIATTSFHFKCVRLLKKTYNKNNLLNISFNDNLSLPYS